MFTYNSGHPMNYSHALCSALMWVRTKLTHTPRWRHQMEAFSALLALSAGNSPVTVNSPHKGQWRGASLICALINDWVNNRKAGDLRRHCGHYDVNVMLHDYFNPWRCHGMKTLSTFLALCEGRRWISLTYGQYSMRSVDVSFVSLKNL